MQISLHSKHLESMAELHVFRIKTPKHEKVGPKAEKSRLEISLLLA